MKKDFYFIKLFILLLIIIIEFITILILIDIKAPRTQKEDILLFWNEFNDNYLIEHNGQVYQFYDSICINEFEDILQYNLEDFIELDQEQQKRLEKIKQDQQKAIKN